VPRKHQLHAAEISQVDMKLRRELEALPPITIYRRLIPSEDGVGDISVQRSKSSMRPIFGAVTATDVTVALRTAHPSLSLTSSAGASLSIPAQEDGSPESRAQGGRIKSTGAFVAAVSFKDGGEVRIKFIVAPLEEIAGVNKKLDMSVDRSTSSASLQAS